MDDSHVSVSVIVPVKDDERVHRLLESLHRQTTPVGDFEVIVVENGSDGLRAVAQRHSILDVRYVHLRRSNPAAARNAGLREAKGRFVLMTDADCVPSPAWIERMTERLATGDWGAVGGPIHKYRPRTFAQQHAITVVDGQRRLNYLPALPLPYVVTANAGYPAALLRDVGGFDEAFRSGSDVDICYRLGLRGLSIGLAPGAVVSHDDRETLAAHFCRFRHYARYQVLLFAKYKSVSRRRFVLNDYPWKRLFGVGLAAPRALGRLLDGDPNLAARLLLQVVEVVGIWIGDISGSIRYRQLYL